MPSEDLKGLRVAILVTDGFEQVELIEPRKALDEAGAETRIVSPKTREVRGWNFTDWGAPCRSRSSSTRPGRRISTRCCCRAG